MPLAGNSPSNMFRPRSNGCAVLVRTYASPARMRRSDKNKTKSRTSELVPQGSKTSGEPPKTNSERKELPYRFPISSLSRHQAHAMILYKDEHVVAVNKPFGYAVHGGPGVRKSLDDLRHFWQFESPELPSLAHRLDKETTGVLVLTRHSDAARGMARHFKLHKVAKKYLALTVGVPSVMEGSITVPLMERNVSSSKTARAGSFRKVLRDDLTKKITEDMVGHAYPEDHRVKVARTDFTVLTTHHSKSALLEVQPVTGFKHQLRVHLAEALGTPVLGDYKYGGSQFRKDEGLIKRLEALGPSFYKGVIYLHAFQLVLPKYSEGCDLVINAPLPQHFTETLQRLSLQLPKCYTDIIGKQRWSYLK